MNMTRDWGILRCIAALAACLLTCACDRLVADVAAPEIPFAPLEDTSLKDPDNPAKVFRVDFARVEHQFPLTRADLMKVTAENLRGLPQEQLDQIYGRITAGPIPDGQYLGDLFFARGDSSKTRIEEVVGGLEGRLADEGVERVEKLGRALWKGKVFNREQRVLRNMIEDLALLSGLIDDASTIPTTTIPRSGVLGRILPGNKVWLLFPAKVYCGQSLVDARRESIIVDYNYSDDIEGYRASPDSLAGRGGLRIRDEIRMIRPGLYLGRAYANRMLLLNFTLYSPEVAEREGPSFDAGGEVKEECWPGEQARNTALR
jgi:hypothetical protein